MSSHSHAVGSFEVSAELIEATQIQQGAARDAALSAVARHLLESPRGGFFPTDIDSDSGHEIKQAVTHGGTLFGFFVLAGRAGGYDAAERERLATLAHLTGRLLHGRQIECMAGPADSTCLEAGSHGRFEQGVGVAP